MPLQGTVYKLAAELRGTQAYTLAELCMDRRTNVARQEPSYVQNGQEANEAVVARWCQPFSQADESLEQGEQRRNGKRLSPRAQRCQRRAGGGIGGREAPRPHPAFQAR